MCSPRGMGASGGGSAAFTASKEQALILLLVQQLAEAQFVRADQAASERLWQEVAVLQLDIERLTHLLYCGLDLGDRQGLRAEDNAWLARRPVNAMARRWGMGGWRPGWEHHQSRPTHRASHAQSQW